jgi:hypothetical protein
MYIALTDMYDNIVGNTNSAKLTLRVDTTYTTNDPYASRYPPILEGTSEF